MIKRPSWAAAVGTIGIIWGCLGLLGAILTMFMPVFMPKLLMEAQRSLTAGQGTQEAGDYYKWMINLWSMPSLRNSCRLLGAIGIFISGFLVFASVSLLQMKRSAVKLIYAALCIEIIVNILLLPHGLILKSINILSGVVIYVILLLVVVTGDKEAFK